MKKLIYLLFSLVLVLMLSSCDVIARQDDKYTYTIIDIYDVVISDEQEKVDDETIVTIYVKYDNNKIYLATLNSDTLSYEVKELEDGTKVLEYKFTLVENSIITILLTEKDQEIVDAYTIKLYGTLDTEYVQDILYHYYEENDIHFVLMSSTGLLYTEAEEYDEVGGYIFHYHNGNKMWVYTNKEFYSLSDAYSEEIVTDTMLDNLVSAINNNFDYPEVTTK